jgi:hypothetical protein
MLIGKFDYVIGNPPWINWDTLPEFYRNSTKHLWDQYDLLEKTGEKGLGKVKKDIAMLFVARCYEKYMKKEGKLGFLIPFTVYKSQAGSGFRKWLINNVDIEKIHDLVELYPFENAVNRTSLIIIKQGKTKLPIPCKLWHNPKSTGIEMEIELNDVKESTNQIDIYFMPLDENNLLSPWMQMAENAYDGIKKVLGESPWYGAHEGINTALNGVYWVQVLEKQPSGLLVSNPPIPGQKKKVKQVTRIVEEDFVFPFIRGREVKRWYIFRDYNWIIIPHDRETGYPIKEEILKINQQNTFSYFSQFKLELEGRSLHKLWGKNNPFYSVYGIGPYTYYPYKVVWKRISGKISGKAELSAAVMGMSDDKFLGLKIIMPYEKLMFIPIKEEKEAYYLASILNSSVLQTVAASYLIETSISDLTKRVNIPKFSMENILHRKLSDLSFEAHQLTKIYYEQKDVSQQEKIAIIEKEINDKTAELFNISEKELYAIEMTLKILIEGYTEEAEIEN